MNKKELQTAQRLVRDYAERIEWCYWGTDRKKYCLTVHWLRGGQRLFHSLQSVIEHMEYKALQANSVSHEQ